MLGIAKFTAAGAAALTLAIAAISAGGMRFAVAGECTGPLRQCLIDIGAECEKTPTGQMVRFPDMAARMMRYEECVGDYYVAHGMANPYKTGPTPAAPQQSLARPAAKPKP